MLSIDRHIRSAFLACVYACGSALVVGCGYATGGIAAAVGGSSGGSSGSNSPASLSDVAIEARTSPATIRFTLTDAGSNPVTVQLDYQDPITSNTVALVLVADPGNEITPDLSGLASSPQGVEHEKRWDFGRADQIGTESLTRDLLVTLSGKEGDSDLEPRAVRVDLGNDPPTLTITSPPDRSLTGVVPVEFTVFDSQEDQVTVEAFYDLLGDDPDQGFLPARGGSAAGPDGQPIVFFWDAQTDIGFTDHDVALKLLPGDEIGVGPPAIDLFRVDNNTEPRIEIDDAALVLSNDRRGGIPVPFTVFDGSDETGEPGDEALVVFQWRKDEQPDFPELAPLRNAADVRVFLDDPKLADLRRELQICTEIPRTFEGKVIPVDATTVRLPELASSAAGALERDPATGELRVVGTFEILTGLTIPSPVKESWTQDPGLVRPVAALPVGNGPRALVLEDTGGAFRLRSLNSATGGAVQLLAQGNHIPTAMAYEHDERSVLLALLDEASDSWELRRVDLATGAGGEGQLLASSFDGATEGGPIRGLVSLGSEAALVTTGSSLVRVNFAAGAAPLISTLFGPPNTPLDGPWGIAVDPLLPHHVYVAENGADRILSITTDQLSATVEVPARGIGVPRPTSLALENGSARLLVVTDSDPDDGTQELRSIELGSPVDLDGDGRADIEVYEIGRGYAATGIATGPDGFRILSLAAASDLAVAGGLVNRTVLERGKATYDPADQSVRLDQPLDPVPERTLRWRLARTVPVIGTPGGTDGVFVWSSEDAGQGSVRLRAVAFDGDRGPQSPSSTSITIRSTLDTAPVLLSGPSKTNPNSLLAADLDLDGDLDLVTANSGTGESGITLFFQGSARSFTPTLLQHPLIETPFSIAAADLDQDGDLDLISTDITAGNVTIFPQTSPGVFCPDPIVLSNPEVEFPRHTIAADLDGDGDLDLAVLELTRIAVFFQISPGMFDDANPLLLEVDSLSFGQKLLAADLDQDGDLDLAVNGQRDPCCRNVVTVIFQTMPGRFDTIDPVVLQQPRAIVTTTDLIAADLDQDGDLDLVAVGFDPPAENRSSLSLFFQTAPGTFDPDPTVLVDPDFEINRPLSVIAADVDRDGDLDLVAGDGIATKLIIHFQTSPGQFDVFPSSIDVPNLTGGQVTAADLDADGHVDLAAILNTGELALYFQTSPGSFDPEPSVLESPALNGPISATAADLDQDGDLDLVSANVGSGNLTIFSQTSPGIFDASSVLEDPFLDGVNSLATADLDQDGDLDLVSSSVSTNSLALFFQTSPGIFGDATVLSAGFLQNAFQVITADMDGDGDVDLVASAQNRISGSRNLSIIFQSSPGTFDLEDRIVIPTHGTSPRVVTAADLDQDGNTDLIAGALGSGNNNITLYFQTSPGVFDEISLTDDDLKFLQAIVAADMDGDGDLDLVMSARTLLPDEANLTVLYQSTPGTFDLEDRIVLSLPGSNSARTVAVADLDQDGDLDLVVPGSFGGGLAIFRQASPSTFDPVPNLLELTGFITKVILADLDQDGDPDLVAADSTFDRLAVFFGSE